MQQQVPGLRGDLRDDHRQPAGRHHVGHQKRFGRSQSRHDMLTFLVLSSLKERGEERGEKWRDEKK